MIERIQSQFFKYAIINLFVSGPTNFELRRLCKVLQLHYSILNNSCCPKPDKFFLLSTIGKTSVVIN